MQFIKEYAVIAQYYITAIEYGDMSGHEPEDIKAITEFIESHPRACFKYSDDVSFRSDEISGLHADCIDVEIWTPIEIATIEDHSEAFDWAYALWYWLSHWHGGQACPKYAAMSSMIPNYEMTNVPSIDFETYDDDDENIQAIEYYQLITEDNWEQINAEFCHYMDNDWDKDE